MNKIYNSCAYFGCAKPVIQRENNIVRRIILFRFPKAEDQPRYEEWLTNCGNPKLRTYSASTVRRHGLCADHFTLDDFSGPGRIRLKRSAVPIKYVARINNSNKNYNEKGQTLENRIEGNNQMKNIVMNTTINENDFDPDECYIVTPEAIRPQTILAASSTHSDSSIALNVHSDIQSSARIKYYVTKNETLKREIKFLRIEIKKLKRKLKAISREKIDKPCKNPKRMQMKLKKSIKELVEQTDLDSAARTIISLLLHEPHSSFNEEQKKFIKELLNHSPTAVKALRKMGCHMPSENTIRNWSKEEKCNSEESETFLEIFKGEIMNLSSEQENCEAVTEETCSDELPDQEKSNNIDDETEIQLYNEHL